MPRPIPAGRLRYRLPPGLPRCKRTRRMRPIVLHRHNDITLQNNAVSVPLFIGTVIHAINVQRHLLLGNLRYNKPYIPHVHTF